MTEQEQTRGIQALASIEKNFETSAGRSKPTATTAEQTADLLALVDYVKALQTENNSLKLGK